MRLPTKPMQLPTSTPTLLNFFESCMQVAMTSLPVAAPRTISSRRITLAGLKKCVPMTDCGREVADAIELAENFFLQRHTFEDSFNNHIDTGEFAVIQRWPDELQTLIDEPLREAAALDGVGIIFLNAGQAP